jgi:hypothetical protein
LEGDVNCRITRLPTDKADAQYPHSLLGPRDERASGNSAPKRDNKSSPPDLDCHVTLPRGSCNGEDDITPGRAALPDFNAGSKRDAAHFQPRQPRLASGLMSAAGLIAAVRSTDAGSSVSAITGREQVQQTTPLFDLLVGE